MFVEQPPQTLHRARVCSIEWSSWTSESSRGHFFYRYSKTGGWHMSHMEKQKWEQPSAKVFPETKAPLFLAITSSNVCFLHCSTQKVCFNIIFSTYILPQRNIRIYLKSVGLVCTKMLFKKDFKWKKLKEEETYIVREDRAFLDLEYHISSIPISIVIRRSRPHQNWEIFFSKNSWVPSPVPRLLCKHIASSSHFTKAGAMILSYVQGIYNLEEDRRIIHKVFGFSSLL